MEAKTDSLTLEKNDVITEPPKMYSVVFWNDDTTPVGYVVELLVNVFTMKREDAIGLTMKIDQEGNGVAGTYIRSIADSKATIVRECNIKSHYPLKVTVEPAV